MSAVWFRLRAETRSVLRSFVAIALLIGLAGGAALAALAGARSTDAAYPHFLREAHASDAGLGIEIVGDSNLPFLDAVERLPQVVDHARGAYAFLAVVGPSGEPDQNSSILGQPLVSVDGRLFRSVDGEKVIRGRHADPNRVDEITVSYPIAKKFRVHLGQVINVTSYSEAAAQTLIGDNTEYVPPDGPRLSLRIVGEVVSPAELAPAGFDNAPVHFTPAFFREYHGRIAMSQSTKVRLRHGAADLPAYRAEVDRLAAGQGRQTFENQQGQTDKVQRSVHLQSLSLRLFAALAAIAGALIVGQALSRQLFIASEEHTILRGIGMSRRQLAVLSLARAVMVGVAGAAVAVTLAIVASPLAPIGLGRVVAPPSGLHADWTVLGLGALAVVLVVLALAVLPTWRGTRGNLIGGAAGAAGGQGTRSRVADVLASAGFPPTAVTGTRLALEPGAGRSTVPVRSTILSVVLAVAALTAALSFGAGLNHLLGTPRLYGWNWDVSVGNPYAGDLRNLVLPALERDHDVARYASASTASVTVEGRALTAMAIAPIRGTITLPVVSGRAPTQPDEISVGPKTLRHIHRKVGDTVVVAGSDGNRRVRIVGRAVYPSLGISDLGGVGEGVGMTSEGLTAIANQATPNEFLVSVAPGARAANVVDRFNRNVARGAVSAVLPIRPTDIENYRAVRPVPLVLAGLLAVTAIVTLAYTLISSARRRRRDLAMLETIGFVRRQVRATMAWQATVLAAIALLVGLPIGIAVGSWGWRVYAVQQGVVPESSVPIVVLGLLVPAMLVIANLVAAVPARTAAHRRPALALRAD
jgi:ABC-type lipoprotein release transport system permease subunit